MYSASFAWGFDIVLMSSYGDHFYRCTIYYSKSRVAAFVIIISLSRPTTEQIPPRISPINLVPC